MLDILEFIFSSFWTWLGTAILIRSIRIISIRTTDTRGE